MDADRRQMAAFVTEHGAVHGAELRVALKWQMDQFYDAVYGNPDRWFMITIDGWDLTDRGREGLVQAIGFRPHVS